MTAYPMTIVLSNGPDLVLTKVQPKERTLEYGDEIGRAVESSQQQVTGDAEREASWLPFETWLPGHRRPSVRGAILAAFEEALRFAVRAEIDGLVYPIDRIRVDSRGAAGTGYRLSLRMIGPNFDFQDADGNPVPLW
jgi:hypothetical protein